MVNPQIFRQYDIRGIVDRDLDAGVTEAVGRAFATVLQRESGTAPPRVALGRDNRPSSAALAAGMRKGLIESGIHVVDVGMVPTPTLSFAAASLGTDGAVQITGSHNPPQYNGIKLTMAGSSLYGEQIQELYALIERGDFPEGRGSLEQREILPEYIRTLAGKFAIDRPLKVAVDCGNGTGSLAAVDLLSALDPRVTVIPLYCDSDGTFPNHHPDPVVDANLADLISSVRENGADVGVAFDGDADRIGAVDDRGRIVRGDTLLLLFGLDLVERRGAGQKVVFDVKCSQALTEGLEEVGGVPIMSATGHSLIKERMKEEHALLAGELSGHIMFADDYYGFDDALFAACLLLSIISRRDEPLSRRLDGFPQFVSTSEIRYRATEETKFPIVARAIEHFSRDHDVISVDGARVLFGDGWGLVRASNTEPSLVARYEARTKERLAQIRNTMESWLRDQGVEI